MKHFTMLIFDMVDEIVDVKALSAGELISARRMAEHVMMTQPCAAGYQLWRKGVRMFSTMPQSTVDPPIAFIAMHRARRGAKTEG